MICCAVNVTLSQPAVEGKCAPVLEGSQKTQIQVLQLTFNYANVMENGKKNLDFVAEFAEFA